jgi:hypothetical protein
VCAQYAISAAVMTITVAASADTMKLAVTMAGADTGGGDAAVRPDEACATVRHSEGAEHRNVTCVRDHPRSGRTMAADTR